MPCNYSNYTKTQLVKKYLMYERAKLNKYRKSTLVAKVKKMYGKKMKY